MRKSLFKTFIMNKHISYCKMACSLGLFALLVVATPAFAQHTATGYFNQGYTYRNEMNPAFAPKDSLSKNYIAMPLLGNVNVGLQGNLGVKDVIYNVDGRTTTFLNAGVSSSEFLSNIHDNNKFNADIKINLLSAGFNAFGGYNTISLNTRASVSANVPGNLLRLAKEGVKNGSYDISDLCVHADSYVELAFGHSRRLNDQWRVGASLKVLFGLGNVDAEFDKALLTLNENEWSVEANAELQASIKGLEYISETKMRGADGEQTEHTYVNDIDIDGYGISGYGLAVDIGAEYTFNEQWKFSAAVLDFGFISWSNNYVASTNGDRYFNTDTYLFSFDDDAYHNTDDEWDRLAEGLADLYELQDNGDQGGRTKMLAATLNFGAEYTLPAYQRLTFGLLNTTRLHGQYSWTDFRISGNVEPVDIFSASLSFAAGTYGCSLGWMLNLHMSGLNLFFAMDHPLGSLSSEGIPLNSNAAANFGLNFLF